MKSTRVGQKWRKENSISFVNGTHVREIKANVGMIFCAESGKFLAFVRKIEFFLVNNNFPLRFFFYSFCDKIIFTSVGADFLLFHKFDQSRPKDFPTGFFEKFLSINFQESSANKTRKLSLAV